MDGCCFWGQKVLEDHYCVNPTVGRIIKSCQLFRDLCRHWELSTEGDHYCAQTEFHDHASLTCPAPVIDVALPELARESIQLIQKQLRSNPFTLSSPQQHCLAHPQAWLGNPYCLTPAALHLTFCFSRHGFVSVDCPSTRQELCIVALDSTSFANRE